MSENHASETEASTSSSGRGKGLQLFNKILLVVLLVLAGVFYMRSLNQNSPAWTTHKETPVTEPVTVSPPPADQQTGAVSGTSSSAEVASHEPVAATTTVPEIPSTKTQEDVAAGQIATEPSADQVPSTIPGEAEALEQLQRIFAPETLPPGKP